MYNTCSYLCKYNENRCCLFLWGKTLLFDKLWKFLKHLERTTDKGILTQQGRRDAEIRHGQRFPGFAMIVIFPIL